MPAPTASASASAPIAGSPALPTGLGTRIERQVALGEQVARALRAEILTGALPVDTLLVEAPLAARFEVSRGPVRDALRTLAAEGLIVSAGRSYRVVGLDERDVRALYALRELLEVYACQQAAAGDPAAVAAKVAAHLAAAQERIVNAHRRTQPGS